jgi:hypothetical protein
MNTVFLSGHPSGSIPAIGEDGSVYVIGSTRGPSGEIPAIDVDTLYAYTSALELKWKIQLDPNLSNPAIGPSGTIYVGSSYGSVYAFSPSGTNVWKFVREGRTSWHRARSSLALSHDEIVYSPYGTSVDAIKGGTLVQRINRTSAPLIGPDGTLYMATWSPQLGFSALTPDGTEKWWVPYPEPRAIDTNGNLFIYSTNSIISVSSTGRIRWEQQLDTPLGLVLGENGTLYVPGRAGTYALSADTGGILWSNSLSGTVSPRAGGGVSILHVSQGGYRESYRGTFRTLGPAGEMLSEYTGTGFNWSTVANHYAPPVRASDGTVYFVYGFTTGFSSGSSLVRATGLDGPANSPWNGYLGNNHNTRSAPFRPVEPPLSLSSTKAGLALTIRATPGAQLQSSTNLVDWNVFRSAESGTNILIETSQDHEYFRLVTP